MIKERQGAADALTERLKEVAAAESRAAVARQDAERLEARLSGAQERDRQRGTRLVEASTAYPRLVREWADRLPDAAVVRTLVALPDEDDDLPVADRCLDRDVAQAAHEVTDPVLAACDVERDEAVVRERSTTADLSKSRAERRRWEQESDPEPPRFPYATGDPCPLRTTRYGRVAWPALPGRGPGWKRYDGPAPLSRLAPENARRLIVQAIDVMAVLAGPATRGRCSGTR